MRLKHCIFCLIAIAVIAPAAVAQMPDTGFGVAGFPAGPGALPPAKGEMVTVNAESMDVTPVKGAPFCATVTTEHTQMFADGNRIHTSDNTKLCRDSQGRTRREADLNLLGAATASTPKRLITIQDPVSGVAYMLDTEQKTARKMPAPPPPLGPRAPGAPGAPEKGERVMVYEGMGGAGQNVFFTHKVINRAEAGSEGPAPATEDLGDQTIAGVHATGTRMTTTIPAGKMGNEQAILVTSERWYSPELKATVMTKHNDPWAGELKTQFTSVNTAEPDSSLFTVPDDYKIIDEKHGMFMMQLPGSAAPPPPPQ